MVTLLDDAGGRELGHGLRRLVSADRSARNLGGGRGGSLHRELAAAAALSVQASIVVD